MYKFNSRHYSTILYKRLRYRSFFFMNLISLFLVKIDLITSVDSITIQSCCYRLTLLHMPMIIRESHGPRLRMSKKRKYIQKESVNNFRYLNKTKHISSSVVYNFVWVIGKGRAMMI